MNPLPQAPFILPYLGVWPRIAAPLRDCGVGSAIVGRVTLGSNAELSPFAALRADGQVVQAGNDFFVGWRGTVHIAHNTLGAILGHGVSLGANAIAHACTVGDGCVVMDNAVVLDGAQVGAGCVIAPGSVVMDRAVMPPGQWCEGVPAAPVRPVGAEELARLHQQLRDAGLASRELPHGPRWAAPGRKGPGFIAATASGEGAVDMGVDASVWFSCVVDAGEHGVRIGARTNVQDNSVLHGKQRVVSIGEDTTIGHNVLLQDCSIGARCLIGMGSQLAPGTVVMDDVLVGGGSTTEPGQVLESGWLWRGRPAVRQSPMNDRRRQMIAGAGAIYCMYGREFGIAQDMAERVNPINNETKVNL